MLLTWTPNAGQKNWRKGASLNQLRRLSDDFWRAKKSCRPLLEAFIVILTGGFLRRRFCRHISRVRLQRISHFLRTALSRLDFSQHVLGGGRNFCGQLLPDLEEAFPGIGVQLGEALWNGSHGEALRS
jgi:hypothetical protein